MHLKSYKKIALIILLLFYVTVTYSQINKSTIILDSIITSKNPNLILNYNFYSKELNKKGISYTVKYFNSKGQVKYSLFEVPVQKIEVIMIKEKLISLKIDLKETNERIEQFEKIFIDYFGPYNAMFSEKRGDQVKLLFGEDNTGFLIDAFLSSENNDGDLLVGYITKEFIDFTKRIKSSD